MNIWAISDLHLGYEENRAALSLNNDYAGDWLILAGDIGETKAHLKTAFDFFSPHFEKLVWVPGNHELWTLGPKDPMRGQEKYLDLVDFCRIHGVLTPEDPYPLVHVGGSKYILASLFLLYDYSFPPPEIAPEKALAWAAEHGLECTDEVFLFSDPYPDKISWCQARVKETREKLVACPVDVPKILVNHFPLREDLAVLPRIPRFKIWCGTKATENWHTEFNAKIVVSGHLHIRSTQWRDQVRFEEVSLGNPRQWSRSKTLDQYLRKIMPAEENALPGEPKWIR